VYAAEIKKRRKNIGYERLKIKSRKKLELRTIQSE
jgi:hypothetical protein